MNNDEDSLQDIQDLIRHAELFTSAIDQCVKGKSEPSIRAWMKVNIESSMCKVQNN
jgi:hypothetical protein